MSLYEVVTYTACVELHAKLILRPFPVLIPPPNTHNKCYSKYDHTKAEVILKKNVHFRDRKSKLLKILSVSSYSVWTPFSQSEGRIQGPGR